MYFGEGVFLETVFWFLRKSRRKISNHNSSFLSVKFVFNFINIPRVISRISISTREGEVFKHQSWEDRTDCLISRKLLRNLFFERKHKRVKNLKRKKNICNRPVTLIVTILILHVMTFCSTNENNRFILILQCIGPPLINNLVLLNYGSVPINLFSGSC